MSISPLSKPVRVFYSYTASARGDKRFFERIKTYLSSAKWREDFSDSFHFDDSFDSVEASKRTGERTDEIPSLNEADIIVLLLSPDYFASERCCNLEMRRALERHKTEATRIIPVLLQETRWDLSPLRDLTILPSDGNPVRRRSKLDTDKALAEVGDGILEVIRRLAGSSNAQRLSLNTLPYGYSPFFTDREDILAAIHTYFTSTFIAWQLPLALSGMPGCGKTQIAAEYVHRYRDKYKDILWLDATSRYSLKGAIVSLVQSLSLAFPDYVDDEHLFHAFKNWLQQHKNWLLILDNLDNFELMHLCVPFQESGHVLLTTHDQATGELAYQVPVGKMALEDNALFLLRRARIVREQQAREQPSETVYTQAARIVEEFDGLTLALDQAGAYIEETKCSLTRYLELYRDHKSELLRRRGKHVRTHPDSVMKTFSLLFHAVAQASSVARELLCLLAFLHPDAIPLDMLEQGVSALDGALHTLTAGAVALDDAIAVLRQYSFVQDHIDPTMLSIHRVVQAILTEELMPRQQHRWASQVVRLVNRVFPEPAFSTWPTCERYFSQARKCASHIIYYQLTHKEAAHLLLRLGTYCYQRAYYQDAIEYLTTALHLYEQAKVPDQIAIAQTSNNLGLVCYRQGKYPEAEAYYQRALDILTRRYGPDHATIAQTLNNLALLYLDGGNYQQAEALYQQTLLIDEQSVGKDHPDIAATLNNLAQTYKEQGKFALAESLYQRAFSIEIHTLEADHPLLASSLNAQAEECERQGHYVEAEELYQRALAMRTSALGPEHPDTAQSLNGLAGLYEVQQRYQEAETLYRRALAIYQQVYGPEHPDTATLLHNLGYLCHQQEQYKEAERLYQQARAIFEKMNTPHLLDLASVLNNLGALYLLREDDQRAEPLLRRGLDIRERVLGLEHLDTAQCLGNLIRLLLRQHLDEQAAPLYQRFLRIIQREYGPDDARTVLAQERYSDLVKRVSSQQKTFSTREVSSIENDIIENRGAG
jgi:tetratricopeptide (TPR) repeat protein